jgi:hypothetical protein
MRAVDVHRDPAGSQGLVIFARGRKTVRRDSCAPRMPTAPMRCWTDAMCFVQASLDECDPLCLCPAAIVRLQSQIEISENMGENATSCRRCIA